MKYAALALLIALVAGGWFYNQHLNRKVMRETSSRIEREIADQAEESRFQREQQHLDKLSADEENARNIEDAIRRR